MPQIDVCLEFDIKKPLPDPRGVEIRTTCGSSTSTAWDQVNFAKETFASQLLIA